MDSPRSSVSYNQNQSYIACSILTNSLNQHPKLLLKKTINQQSNQSLINNNMNVYDALLRLMKSLIKYLKQLCLNTSGLSQINVCLNPYLQQVEQFIKEFKKNYSWDYLQKGKQKRIDVISNHYIKQILQNFLKEYNRLLETIITKITKYNYDKKLKYLIETVIKQIFTEILRLSYQIKINQNILQKKYSKKSIFILIYCLKNIFNKYGCVRGAYGRLKQSYKDRVKSDQIFVKKFQMKIVQLESISKNIKLKNISKYLYLWRINAKNQKQLENNAIDEFGQDFLKMVVKSQLEGDCLQRIINQLLENYVRNLYEQQKGSQNNTKIKFISNKTEQLHQIIKDGTTSRKDSFRKYSQHLTKSRQVSPQKITKCLETGEIQSYKHQTIGGLMLIPIQMMGVIQLSWNTQLSMNVFRFTLRIVQEYRFLICIAYQLRKKINCFVQKINDASWHHKFYEYYLHPNINSLQSSQTIELQLRKKTLKKGLTKQTKQVQSNIQSRLLQRYNTFIQNSMIEQQSQIDQETVQQTKILKYLQYLNIDSIVIYHLNHSNKPCFVLNDFIPFSEDLQKSIMEGFCQSKLQYKIVRNMRNIYVKRLSDFQFCKCILKEENGNEPLWQPIILYLLPILENQTICKKNQQKQVVEKDINNQMISYHQVPVDNLLKLSSINNVLQLESQVYQYLKNNISQKLFAKILYCLEPSIYWTTNLVDGNYHIVQLLSLPISPSESQIKSSNSYYSYISALLKQNPLFENPTLQIYECQLNKFLNILYLIRKKYIFIIGYYSSTMDINDKYLQILKRVIDVIDGNNSVVKEIDVVQWINQEDAKIRDQVTVFKMYQIMMENLPNYCQIESQSPKNQPWWISISHYIKTKLLKESTYINFYKYQKSKLKNIQTNQQLIIKQQELLQLSQSFCSHYTLLNKHYRCQIRNNNNKNKIKPKYVNIPNFANQIELKEKFKGFAQRKYHFDGKIIHQQYDRWKSILNLKQGQTNGHIFLPILQENIIVAIQIKLDFLYNLTANVMSAICCSVKQLVKDTISTIRLRYKYQKQCLIKNILLPLSRQVKIMRMKQCIKKFKQLRKIKLSSSIKILLGASNLLISFELKKLRDSFNKMIEISYNKKYYYENICKILESAYKKIIFNKIIKKLKSKLQTQSIINKFIKIISIKHINQYHDCINSIRIIADIKQNHKQINRLQSCKIISKILKYKINLNYKSLWVCYQSRQSDIKQIIQILKEQYQLTLFQNLKNFLRFVQERLICGIGHVSQNTCLLKFGVRREGILYLWNKQANDIGQLVWDQQNNKIGYTCIEIEQIESHWIVFKLQHLSSKIQLKHQRQWLIQLIQSAIIPSYISYYKSLLSKIKILVFSIPDNKNKAFKKLKVLNKTLLMKQVQQIDTDYKQIYKKNQKLKQEYEEIQNMHKYPKDKILIFKDKIKLIQDKNSHLAVNYHIRRKTYSIYRVLYYLEKKSTLEIQNDSNLENYNEKCCQYEGKKKQYKDRAIIVVNRSIKRVIIDNQSKIIKDCFLKLWGTNKCQNSTYRSIHTLR